MSQDVAEFEYACTEQENTFARIFALTGDLVAAWLEAGYPEHEPRKIRREAAQLVAQERIDERIVFYRQKLHEKLDISEDRVLREMAAIAFFDPADAFHPDGTPKLLNEMPPHVRAAIKEFRVSENVHGEILHTMKGWDKLKALNMIVDVKNMRRDRDAERAPKVVLEFSQPMNVEVRDGAGGQGSGRQIEGDGEV